MTFLNSRKKTKKEIMSLTSEANHWGHLFQTITDSIANAIHRNSSLQIKHLEVFILMSRRLLIEHQPRLSEISSRLTQNGIAHAISYVAPGQLEPGAHRIVIFSLDSN